MTFLYRAWNERLYYNLQDDSIVVPETSYILRQLYAERTGKTRSRGTAAA